MEINYFADDVVVYCGLYIRGRGEVEVEVVSSEVSLDPVWRSVSQCWRAQARPSLRSRTVLRCSQVRLQRLEQIRALVVLTFINSLAVLRILGFFD